MIDIKIPQNNPRANYLRYRETIDKVIKDVLDSGVYILGEQVEKFEKEFSSYLDVNHTVGVASGTDAITLALLACGVGIGSRVFTVSHTSIATIAGILRTGATPVLVDVNPHTYTMDIDSLDKTIKSLVCNQSVIRNAIVPVHLYGQAVDMYEIKHIADKYNMIVVEDCAQAHGAYWDNRKVGTFGDAGAFSFYPTKNLGALGDGGAVVTNDYHVARKVREIGQYGWNKKEYCVGTGINSRLDELQAAVLRAKLVFLDINNSERRHIAEAYREIGNDTYIAHPETHSVAQHCWHQYVIKINNREKLRNFLSNRGIETAIHYPIPAHMQIGYSNRVYVLNKLKETENISSRILSLPMYPELWQDNGITKESRDVNVVKDAIEEFVVREKPYPD